MKTFLHLFATYLGKKAIVGVVLVSLLAPPMFAMAPQQAHGGAQPVIEVGANVVVNTVTSIVTTSLEIIQSFLDGIVWHLTKMLIQTMTIEIVNWINRDFEGYPGFVDNMKGFLTDIADQAVGSFISENNLEYLCNPLDIRIALVVNYYSPTQDRYSCTLSRVIQNVEGFLRGNFQEGGWTGWFAVSYQSSPMNEYFRANAEMRLRIAGLREQQVAQLNFGRGFFSDLSFEACKGVGVSGALLGGNTILNTAESAGAPSADGSDAISQAGTYYQPGADRGDCYNTTPGALIAGHMDWVTTSPLRQMELADEINEMIGAIMSALMMKLLRDGLAMLSSEGRGRGIPGQSFIDEMGRDTEQADFVRQNIIVQIDREIAEELELRRMLQCDGAGAASTAQIDNSEFTEAGGNGDNRIDPNERVIIPESTRVDTIGLTADTIAEQGDRFGAQDSAGNAISSEDIRTALNDLGLTDSSGNLRAGVSLEDLGIEGSLTVDSGGNVRVGNTQITNVYTSAAGSGAAMLLGLTGPVGFVAGAVITAFANDYFDIEQSVVTTTLRDFIFGRELEDEVRSESFGSGGNISGGSGNETSGSSNEGTTHGDQGDRGVTGDASQPSF